MQCQNQKRRTVQEVDHAGAQPLPDAWREIVSESCLTALYRRLVFERLAGRILGTTGTGESEGIPASGGVHAQAWLRTRSGRTGTLETNTPCIGGTLMNDRETDSQGIPTLQARFVAPGANGEATFRPLLAVGRYLGGLPKSRSHKERAGGVAGAFSGGCVDSPTDAGSAPASVWAC